MAKRADPLRIYAIVFTALALGACVPDSLPRLSDLNAAAHTARPAMRWDHRPEAAEWTTRSLTAIAAQDAALAAQTPGDIDAWCPAYSDAPLPQRRAFWAGLLSAVAKYESSWNPKAAGGGGRYVGLMQISPKTAANYGCAATSAAGLKDGGANLECAVQIMARQVARDGVVAGGGSQGIGRDWYPLRKSAARREMSEWTQSQSYCQKG